MREFLNERRRVAIGGIGGSGTRLGAAVLQILGYYIGDDLNEALDNLWFTLLFKHHAILTKHDAEFRSLAELFLSRMSGYTNFREDQHEWLLKFAEQERPQHSRSWLQERAESFVRKATSKQNGQPWGWKEPNTHIIVDRLLNSCPDLLYIHFQRHPLDVAFSSNQNQLEKWGPTILNREVELRPRDSLAFWCAVDRRLSVVTKLWPNRILMIDYDEFCLEPERHGFEISNFLRVAPPWNYREKLSHLIDRRLISSGRYKSADLTQFDPDDMGYVQKLGYIV